MSGFVFGVGAISIFIFFRVLLFNTEIKRWPNGYKDFMSYKMRKFSIFIITFYSLIVFMIGFPKSDHGHGFSFFLLFLLSLFSLPILYLFHLIRKDKNDKSGL